MNNDLISRSALRKALEVTQYNDIDDLTRTERLIDNAPTVTIKEWKKEMPIYIKDAMLEALRPQGETQDKKIEAIIEELESRKDYGTEYAQAMEDVIVILKAQFGIK